MKLALTSLLALTLTGCLRGHVVRVVEGREIEGHYVSPAAYAAYARGALLEREGNLAEAAKHYERAADLGGDAAAYARLGAVSCALSRNEDAREAFADGLAADPDAALVHRERGRCALRRGALAEAVSASREAVRADPEDRESILLLADALARTGRAEEAAILRGELARRTSASTSVAAAGRPGGDGSPAGGASISSSLVGPGVDLTEALRNARPTPATIDAALARGDLAEAAALGTAGRLSPADLSARALAHGHAGWALDTATHVAAADPADGTAWCVAVAAAIRQGDEVALRERLQRLPRSEPSALASLLLAEASLLRGGPAAARAFVPAAALERERRDPLEERVRRRLVASLAAAP